MLFESQAIVFLKIWIDTALQGMQAQQMRGKTMQVYYGGAVAAPVFSEVVQQTLRMMGAQPDMAVKPQIVADTVEESV